MTDATSTAPDHWIQRFHTIIPFVNASGMEVRDHQPAKATLVLPPRPDWTGDTQHHLIHPGCLSVLADSACGTAVAMALEVPEPFATLDLRMDYLRPAMAGHELICRADCHRLSRSVAFVRGELYQAGHDEPVATVHAAFMRATAKGAREAAPDKTTAVPTWTAPCESDTPALPAGRSPYVDFLGVRCMPRSNNSPLFKLPFRPELIGNPMLPALHGGVLAGFAETAAVLHLAAIAEVDPYTGQAPRGVDFSIDYLRSAKPIDTYAGCTTIRLGARVALVQISLWQDEPARPVALARAHLLLPKAA